MTYNVSSGILIVDSTTAAATTTTCSWNDRIYRVCIGAVVASTVHCYAGGSGFSPGPGWSFVYVNVHLRCTQLTQL